MTEFSHLFSSSTRRHLADGHLWLSIFTRPPRSRFTRVQRVSVGMAVLCLTMVVNAAWYHRTPDQPSSSAINIGPLSLSSEQIGVGIMSDLICFLPTFLIILFFRKSRPRRLRPSRIQEALKRQRDEWKKQLPEQRSPEPSTKGPGGQKQKHRRDEEAHVIRRKRKFSLPWWCVIFGWILVIASVSVSLFFLWAYGIQFGNYKTTKWLTALVISFLSSIFLTQPLKVFLIAMVLSCICRKTDFDEDDADEDEEDARLETDEEWLHDPGVSRKKRTPYRPMDREVLNAARKAREREIQVYQLVKEVAAYFLYLWVIMILSYGNRDPSSFYLRETLINSFIKPRDAWNDFNKVNTDKCFWNWTRAVLIPELIAGKWYNDKPPLGLKLFLDDRNNVKIGYAVLRQVRIKPNSCRVPHEMTAITPNCAEYGGILGEDSKLYGRYWSTDYKPDTPIPPEYKYLTARQLRGYPYWGQIDWYGGGGYVVPLLGRRADLLKKMTRLEEEGWLNKHTRAVFVEFGVYNSQVNLFAAVTLVAEFVPGGGVVSSYQISPLRLLYYHTGFGFLQLVCEIVFLLFMAFFTVREARNLARQRLRYFGQYWNNAELSGLIVSYAAVAVYVYRSFVTKDVLRVFTETSGSGYVKLQEAVLLDDVLCYQIAFLMTLSTLKFLKLLRFNRRIGMLSSTLRKCAQELRSYGVCLMIVFLAFVIFFWLLLGRHMRQFASFVGAFESSISMMLKKFDYEEMAAASPILTPIVFFTFSLATSLVLINILLTIIIQSFEDVKHDINLQSKEHEIFSFLLDKVKTTIGFGSSRIHPFVALTKTKLLPDT